MFASDWPAWATEPVELVAPDPGWRERGEQECRLLETSLAPWLVSGVDHVGSTAVPGLAAKPILDLQTMIADLDCAPRIAATLGPAGWHYVDPELDGRPWRRFYVKVNAGRRAAHLHLVTRNSARWHDQLEFRDALRGDPALAGRYATLKWALAAQHPADREAYTAGKADFVDAVLKTHRAGHRRSS